MTTAASDALGARLSGAPGRRGKGETGGKSRERGGEEPDFQGGLPGRVFSGSGKKKRVARSCHPLLRKLAKPQGQGLIEETRTGRLVLLLRSGWPRQSRRRRSPFVKLALNSPTYGGWAGWDRRRCPHPLSGRGRWRCRSPRVAPPPLVTPSPTCGASPCGLVTMLASINSTDQLLASPPDSSKLSMVPVKWCLAC